jgi:hypothetical protein
MFGSKPWILYNPIPTIGELDERFKSPPWKGGIGATLSRVRIPRSPPFFNQMSFINFFKSNFN